MAEQEKKTRMPKGSTPPIYSLKEAADVIRDLGERGLPSLSRERLAAILGHKTTNSSTFSNRLSALRAFGLVSVDGETVALTETGKALAFGKTDSEKKRAMQEAFASIPTLNKVWGFYKDKRLRSDAREDVMVNQGEVLDQFKKEWADYFESALTDAGLIIQEGNEKIVASSFTKVATSNGGHESQAEKEKKAQDGEGVTRQPPPTPPGDSVNLLDAFIRSFKGNVVRRSLSSDREFVMIIPEDLTSADLSRISKILETTKAGLSGYLSDNEVMPTS